MIELAPVKSLKIDGAASDLDERVRGSINGYVGSVVSIDGEVSHIVVEEELSQSELDSLRTEFGVSFETI